MIWWQYLMLVNIYLVVFYGFYVLLLSKETFFQLNRVYLVSAAMLSFIIPLIQSDWVQNLFITQEVKLTIYNSPVMVYQFQPVQHTQLTIGQIVIAVYLVGITLLTGRFIWQMIVLKQLINEPEPIAPYSFFKKIKVADDQENHEVISAHEHVHAKQWHSADVLLIEAIMIINWFNPVVYFYRHAIKHIHEFIADRQALKAGSNKRDYALLLLSQTFHAPVHRFVNPFFNHSLLKQRIMMLQKNKSQRTALIKYGLSAPLFVLMLILSSATVDNSKTIININKKAGQAFSAPVTTLILEKADNETNATSAADTSKRTNGPVFTEVEQVPEFPGGLSAFGEFLGKNIKYPVKMREQHIQGRVIIGFVVETDGTLTNFNIKRSIGYGGDEESIRVLALSPKWKPGIQNGRPVRVAFAVPIQYTLADDGPKKPVKNATGEVTEKQDSKNHSPEFPGGINAFGQFLAKNIKYPAKMREKGVQARVLISFTVDKDGSLSNFHVLHPIAGGFDEESIRVLAMSPKWNPAVKNGKPVKVVYAVPIAYTLADDTKSKTNKTGAATENKDHETPVAETTTGIKDETKFAWQEKSAIAENVKTAPLFILDGKQIYSLDKIDPATIESISVLKDKSAIEQYGPKGVNGVVLVTLKKVK